MKKPLGLTENDTLEDALQRAELVSNDKMYSGSLLNNKDLRRVVLLGYEYRKSEAVKQEAINLLNDIQQGFAKNIGYSMYSRLREFLIRHL